MFPYLNVFIKISSTLYISIKNYNKKNPSQDKHGNVFNALNTLWAKSLFFTIHSILYFLRGKKTFIHFPICHIIINIGSSQQPFWISDNYKKKKYEIFKGSSNDHLWPTWSSD